MDVKNWTVCVLEPNKFERKLIAELLQNAGVERVWCTELADEALTMLASYRANIIITSFDLAEEDAAAWTRTFRRSKRVADRKAAVFVTSAAFSRAIAEKCRHAGANALIGKPLSAKLLIATIKKVLTQPREFINADGYVGPCRRAGIVTAGDPQKRRRADMKGASAMTLEQAVGALAAASHAYLLDQRQAKTCEAALRFVQAYAVNAGDGPLRRVCVSFAQQLAAKNQRADLVRPVIETCVESVVKLTAGDIKPAEREALAERVSLIVAAAMAPRAA